MKPVWQLDGEDIQQLQGNSPRFVRLVNALLFCQAKEGKLPDSCVHLSQTDTERDGGVDGILDRPISEENDPTGRFAVPTCWQFKASPTGNIKPKRGKGGQQIALRQEINKPAASKLIELGYGYRFCIADDMSGPKKMQWEGWLLEEAKKINPVAPAPMVLTASDLAFWANRFKPLVVDYFRPDLGEFSSLEMSAQGDCRSDAGIRCDRGMGRRLPGDPRACGLQSADRNGFDCAGRSRSRQDPMHV